MEACEEVRDATPSYSICGRRSPVGEAPVFAWCCSSRLRHAVESPRIVATRRLLKDAFKRRRKLAAVYRCRRMPHQPTLNPFPAAGPQARNCVTKVGASVPSVVWLQWGRKPDLKAAAGCRDSAREHCGPNTVVVKTAWPASTPSVRDWGAGVGWCAAPDS